MLPVAVIFSCVLPRLFVHRHLHATICSSRFLSLLYFKIILSAIIIQNVLSHMSLIVGKLKKESYFMFKI